MPSPLTVLRNAITAAIPRTARPVPPPASVTLPALCEWALRSGVAPAELSQLAAEALGLSFRSDLAGVTPAADFLAAVPIALARQHKVLGLSDDDGRLTLALGDPAKLQQLPVISRFLSRSASPVLAPPDVVLAAINGAYQQRTGQAQAAIDKLDRSQVLEEVGRLTREDLLDNASRAPVIKLVNLILFEAGKANASDVHVQPYEERLLVRTRVDGVLYDAFELPKNVQEEVISRIKVMGRMNIAEKRLPQDGRATVQIGDRVVDLRIASLPTSYGERIVIRLLEKSARLLDLAEIGMDPHTLGQFAELIRSEHGLVLVTGPTGSGKSTTLYGALRRIDSKEKNVLTLEDPIEYQLEGISQTQISEKKGMTFASGLRSVLRQDPDVIMVGEIRDRETATMAIQSSLTGHLVFSTLHTNDAASAVTRLLDLGIEPYLVASSVVAVMAQRLVRRVCPSCSEPYTPDAAELAFLGLSPEQTTGMLKGRGCPACRNTGYKGRLGTFELLVLDEQTRHLIQSRATAGEIKSAAVAAGMRTLREDGLIKVLGGLTTTPELERVTMRPDEEEADGREPGVAPVMSAP
ncbi:MAG TPA: type II secretion system ATPase GspE [Tepidisphaeraceae bacterium]|nr:type II secretion system ATPase GspE [Tepidisphaeraceae bacterium]